MSDDDIKALVAFANACIDIAFEGGSLDGDDMKNLAIKHGLLVETPYDHAKHGDDDVLAGFNNRWWFVRAPVLKAGADL